MFPRNPRGIKRILNIYSLAREDYWLNYRDEYYVDKLNPFPPTGLDFFLAITLLIERTQHRAPL